MPFPLEDNTRGVIRDHFRKKHLSWDEDYFIGILQDPKSSKYDVYWAVIALREYGTTRSIGALKEKLHYPMQDVKSTAVLTIAHIARNSETPLYGQLLLDPTYREKVYAMWAILDAADERAVDAVLEYFRRNRSRLRKGELRNETVLYGLEYLEKFIDQDPRIPAFFNEVRQFISNLTDKDSICTRVKFFRESALTRLMGSALRHRLLKGKTNR